MPPVPDTNLIAVLIIEAFFLTARDGLVTVFFQQDGYGRFVTVFGSLSIDNRGRTGMFMVCSVLLTTLDRNASTGWHQASPWQDKTGFMASDNDDKLDSTNVDLLKADERYHFKLSDILRKRNRPLLLMIDKDCDLKSSSVPADGPEIELRLVELALQEVRALFESEFKSEKNVRRLIVEKPGERCALVILDKQLFSLRIFPFYGPGKHEMLNLLALLVEPVTKPATEGIEFDKVREQFGLSKRETDVLKALMSGETDKVLARDLGLSVETVRAYLKSIRMKLDVSTRTAVVHRVHEMFDSDSSGRS